MVSIIEYTKLAEEERNVLSYKERAEADYFMDMSTAARIGREEGASTRELEIARSMKADGDPVEKIARNTGLSEEVIEAL